ncbi:MAG: neutral/alkaline non-lysosomal ceramidase N-terminal domain-containing protein [Acidobacteriota bacterium]
MDRREFLTAAVAIGLTSRRVALAPSPVRAGVATIDITPEQSLWMAGFARRSQPSQGTAMPLHAKALALQFGTQATAVLVTVDLLGVTAGMTGRVAAVVSRRHGIRRANLLFNASHTHCGPVVDEQLSVAYDLSPEQWAALRAYTTRLEANLATVIGDAVSRLRPARVAYGQDQADFAANRRVKFTPLGPVDHSVPVLQVDDPDGAPVAIVFGYACHNTTLQDTFVRYHGDYAGVAQAVLEKRHPGSIALFVAGCGADANPMPRGTLELVEAHGTALADAVDRALKSAAPIEPFLRTAYGHVDLPFARGQAREAWRRRLDVDEIYKARHTALMQAVVARDGRLPTAQSDPVQVWRFGSGLTLVALGGEVVVDYALRLAREYPDRRIWAAGYSNDVFGYVPSRRVLREGGYEGGDAMIYYGRPGPFTEDVEDLIVGEVRRLAGDRR